MRYGIHLFLALLVLRFYYGQLLINMQFMVDALQIALHRTTMSARVSRIQRANIGISIHPFFCGDRAKRTNLLLPRSLMGDGTARTIHTIPFIFTRFGNDFFREKYNAHFYYFYVGNNFNTHATWKRNG